MKKVFLAGEGPNDLGSRSGNPAYAADRDPGVLEALMRQVRAEGWEVIGAINWRDIKKFKAGDHASAEARNVLGATQRALDAGADALAFVRDRDWVQSRSGDVDDGVERARALFPAVQVGGGIAIEMLEAWLLALDGRTGSEHERNPKKKAANLGLIDSASKVAHVQSRGLNGVAADAKSLHAWIASVRSLLSD